MSKTYNWGVIGLGRIAHKFVQDLDLLPQANLQAVASRSEERARAFALQYGANHYYGSYEEIVHCPNLDVVYIATPHTGHRAATLLCLEADIPVLCEKPFAMNGHEVKQMVDIARGRQVFLMEAIWTRFMPTIEKALELIAAGRIGQVVSVKADFGFKADFDPEGRLFNRDLGGGALLDIGIYPVFLALLILGKPDRMTALAHLGQTGVDEEIGALLHYDSGQMAHLHATIRTNTKTEAFIYGDEGVIHIETRWHEPSKLNLWRFGERPETFSFAYRGKGYEYEAEEVMRCLEAGKTESDQLPLSFSETLIGILDELREQIGLRYPADGA
jgi:predicted dehydrogenase